ncbi:mannosyl phosphorylinositol ceramide synthase SUR1 [Protomyces lactucae-debilis]|uniref:Mannosyl phosphorylinositol ceramide synthase SUR1 n=1 Tax=Protomyces lactucae-debilis TaxID=2754530 RepID=A0A1Y2EWT2_PROLT|nr:mannosyl phosphorylinositol ceramide synthase SUR1 [Protomyces lactucae-debilis]ORY76062.1 mannosyl phosphorylinositol ceramide synthase SUR1 [Protomyces lactucae-debilis]
MRRSVAIFFLCQFIILGSLCWSCRWLFVLLVDTGASDAIRSIEIPGMGSQLIETRPQLVPKIIHQTWKNETIPAHWVEPHETCKALHPDYKHILWTDAMGREFIKREYPWFLEQFDNYPYNIQRADAIRYFILSHYGGIYIDLDDGCNRKLDPLLSFSAFVRKTKPTGISNDIMGSIPQHPFFKDVIENLRPMARDWKLPYLTVMASTGPLFLSLVWLSYKRGTVLDEDRVRIIMPDEYMYRPWSFFLHYEGSSWHDGDSGLIFWMKSHWFLLFVVGWIIGLSVIAGMYVFMQRLKQRRDPSRPAKLDAYRALKQMEEGSSRTQ